MKQILYFFPLLLLLSGCSKEPTAEFNYIISGRTVTFANMSSNADSYTWDFGDNSSNAYVKNPKHTYAHNGNYKVSLTAYGDGGSTETSKWIEINGSNGSGTTTDPDPTPNPGSQYSGFRITSFTIRDIDFEAPDGMRWDVNSGPDIQIEVWQGSSCLWDMSNYIQNVGQSDLPLTITPKGAISAYIGNTYTVRVIDYDDFSDNDLMFSFKFNPSNYRSTAPNVISLSGNGNAIDLNVSWIK